MLLEFSVTNFRSFKERATLSLLAAEDEHAHPESIVLAPDGTRLLRTAAVYGANASGKSNLIKALRFVRDFVQSSFKESQAGDPISVQRFRLSAESMRRPCEFEIVFYQEGARYRYGFAVDERHVQEEWLFRGCGAEESELFKRSAADDSSIQVAQAFGMPKNFRTRENALFLSTAAQHATEKDLAARLIAWFRELRLMSGLSDEGHQKATERMLRDPEPRAEILALARLADPTIQGLSVGRKRITTEQPPLETLLQHLRGDTEVITHRQQLDEAGQPGALVDFAWSDESEGTRKLIALSALLLEALHGSRVVVIDELDARFHPLLTREIIRLFQAAGDRSRAQLLFATHDTNLLDRRLLRRDQIWFTEKDQSASSNLYSLAEYQVPESAGFEQDYIQGRYGAIPFLGRFPFSAKAEG